MTTLRPYQSQAIDAVLDYWGNGGGNPLVAMATGTGKSVVIANLVRELHEINPDIRVLMLVHVKELVAQNVQALIRSYPGAQIGINSAGLGRRDKRQPILFASIQSVHRLGPHDIGQRDIVLIDEAHLVPRSGEGMYLSLLDRLRTASPELRVAGFTATPYRMDSGRLDEGDGRLFDDVAFNYGIARGIKDGFLSPLVSKATAAAMDVSGVARRGGEFIAGALEVAVDQDWITRGAVEEMVSLGESRKSWLAFCAGVKHAEHVRDAVRDRGITCEMVTGDTPAGEREVPPELLKYKGERDQKKNRLSHWIWRQYASCFWDDIRLGRVLPYRGTKEPDDEKHVHPLQIDAIERAIVLWSNPGDVVLTPFMGVGSEVYGALVNGRRALGVELNGSYFRQAVKNVRSVTFGVAPEADEDDDMFAAHGPEAAE